MSKEMTRRWRYRATVLSVALAALAYLGLSLWVGWHDVPNALSKVGVTGVCIALALSLVNYGLRFVRWHAYLSLLGHAVPWRASLRIYLAGFALTTTPAKAGETLRSLLLTRHGVPYYSSLAAFFSERLSDLFAIVLLTLAGLSAYPNAGPLIAVGTALVCLGIGFLSSQRLLERTEVFVGGRWHNAIGVRSVFRTVREAGRLHGLSVLAAATALGVVAWGAEAFAFHLMLRWMGFDATLAFGVFVYAVSMLAGALSFMPGGLGGAEGMMLALLSWGGMSAADAVAATVLIRLVTLWFAVAIGAVMLWLEPRT